MKIKTKLICGAIGLSLIPVLISGIIISTTAIKLGKESLQEQAKSHLISVRDMTSENITGYFDTIKNQTLTFSNNRMIIDAMVEFKAAFNNYVDEDTSFYTPQMKEDVRQYYNQDFSKKYRASNDETNPNVERLMTGLDSQSIALQHLFISNNSSPVGEKDELVKADNNSRYSLAHELYHPHIRDFLQRFEYYDIFLVDPDSGDIIYSVFKELDYTTSLIDGPYANSGIAEAFRQANASGNRDSVVLTDFKPYTPSYELPASFIASPIYDGDNKVGILIFQMPIDKINRVMTHNERWQETGLGESGETYLVGEDFTMRSQSRFMIEDEQGYLQLMQDIGLNTDVITSLVDKGTSIGLQPVKTEGTKNAIAGSQGFAIFPDYRGVRVLSAYKLLEIEGLKWAIMSEIDEEEAFRPIGRLTDHIVNTLITVSLITLIIGATIGLLFAVYIIRPITHTVKMVKDIAEGRGDLTQRLDSNRNDELGELSHWFNSFIGKLQVMVTDLNHTAVNLATSSEQLSSVSSETKENINQQHSETAQAATAMTQMTLAVQEVAQNASDAANSATDAHSVSNGGQEIIQDCGDSIEKLAADIDGAAEVISVLHHDSEEVGGVLAVIESIAEQTNLLALNAAIEAARAGESGRGFAVVADEVRTLAQRTQDSTKQIQNIINRLQSGTTSAVALMEKSKESSQLSRDKALQANSAFQDIVKAIFEINSNSIQIASASEQQHATVNEVSQNVVSISTASETNQQNVVSIAQASSELSNLAIDIKTMLESYKV